MKKSKTKMNPKRRKVTFSLNAPKAKKVAVLGDFNKWKDNTHVMKKMENGMWLKTAMLLAGTYEYRFLVDGQWQNDQKNDRVCWNSFGTQNNILHVPAK